MRRHAKKWIIIFVAIVASGTSSLYAMDPNDGKPSHCTDLLVKKSASLDERYREVLSTTPPDAFLRRSAHVSRLLDEMFRPIVVEFEAKTSQISNEAFEELNKDLPKMALIHGPLPHPHTAIEIFANTSPRIVYPQRLGSEMVDLVKMRKYHGASYTHQHRDVNDVYDLLTESLWDPYGKYFDEHNGNRDQLNTNTKFAVYLYNASKIKPEFRATSNFSLPRIFWVEIETKLLAKNFMFDAISAGKTENSIRFMNRLLRTNTLAEHLVETMLRDSASQRASDSGVLIKNQMARGSDQESGLLKEQKPEEPLLGALQEGILTITQGISFLLADRMDQLDEQQLLDLAKKLLSADPVTKRSPIVDFALRAPMGFLAPMVLNGLSFSPAIIENGSTVSLSPAFLEVLRNLRADDQEDMRKEIISAMKGREFKSDLISKDGKSDESLVASVCRTKLGMGCPIAHQKKEEGISTLQILANVYLKFLERTP